MKKLSTFIATVLFATAAAAQTAEYEDRVINGDAEGEDVSCFWAHDFNVGDNVAARIVVDPTDENNHCYSVTSVGDTGDDWATQFFIRATDPKLEAGDKLRLTMRVRADKATNMQTQAHNEPGDYNYWNMFGDIAVTTEWNTITVTATLSANAAYGEGNTADSESAKEMHTVAFNCFVLKEDNNYYFDDIKLEVQPATPPSDFKGWFELVRNGDLKSDIVSNFVSRDGDYPGESMDDQGNRVNPDRPATIIIDSDGKPCIPVRTVAASYTNEDGQARYIYENGTDVELTDWQSQFFVTSNHVFTTAGQKMKFKFSARADKPCKVSTQIHRTPGNYIHYQLFGDFELTEEWQEWEQEVELDGTQAQDAQTVAFNLNVTKDYDNVIYFRDISMCCNKADVTDETLTLGTGEFYLPVAKLCDGVCQVDVDVTALVNTFKIDDLSSYVTKDVMKINENAAGTKLSFAFAPESGQFIDDDGTLNETGGVCVEVDPEQCKDNKMHFVITNVGDEFAEGKKINTRFCFVDEEGWYYMYKVTFVDQKTYESMAGIREVVGDWNKRGGVFTLDGRRMGNELKQMRKGLYIANGQKVIVK